MSDKARVSVDSDFAWAVMIAFLFFWQQSGWYRVDCALGVQKACDLIASEEDYTGAQQ